jgi:hypothetical protein
MFKKAKQRIARRKTSISPKVGSRRKTSRSPKEGSSRSQGGDESTEGSTLLDPTTEEKEKDSAMTEETPLMPK